MEIGKYDIPFYSILKDPAVVSHSENITCVADFVTFHSNILNNRKYDTHCTQIFERKKSCCLPRHIMILNTKTSNKDFKTLDGVLCPNLASCWCDFGQLWRLWNDAGESSASGIVASLVLHSISYILCMHSIV